MLHPGFRSLQTSLSLLTLSISLTAAQQASPQTPNAQLPQPSSVPFRLINGFAIIVPVILNGQGPYDFLFDTGCTITAIDPRLARSLNLELQGPATVTSLVRRLPVSQAQVNSLSVGAMNKSDLQVIVRDIDGLRQAIPSIRGVLGQNALDGTSYLLDYPRHTLQFDLHEDLLHSLTGSRRPLIKIPVDNYTQYSNPAICVELSGRGQCDRTLLLDTGSASVVLFEDAQLPSPSFATTSVKDAAGGIRLAATRPIHLCLGNACTNVIAHSLSFRDHTPQIDGLLPANLFSRLYISNTGGFLIADPTPQPRQSVPQSTATLTQAKTQDQSYGFLAR